MERVISFYFLVTEGRVCFWWTFFLGQPVPNQKFQILTIVSAECYRQIRTKHIIYYKTTYIEPNPTDEVHMKCLDDDESYTRNLLPTSPVF